jgi:hypothetical protein
LGDLHTVKIVGVDGLLLFEQDVLFPVPPQAVDDRMISSSLAWNAPVAQGR